MLSENNNIIIIIIIIIIINAYDRWELSLLEIWVIFSR